MNLTDDVFRGVHRGRRKHEGSFDIRLAHSYWSLYAALPDDMQAMLERARSAGVRSMIITGGSFEESKSALGMAKEHGLAHMASLDPSRTFLYYLPRVLRHGGMSSYEVVRIRKTQRWTRGILIVSRSTH